MNSPLFLPEEKVLEAWLRTHSFGVFVRELKLHTELAQKVITPEDLATTLFVLRNEHRTGTLNKHTLKRQTPELINALSAHFPHHQ